MEKIAKKLNQKIAKQEIPKFLDSPDKYVYDVYCSMLADFAEMSGIKDVEAKELEIYTGQEVEDITKKLKKAKDHYTLLVNKLFEFFDEFDLEKDNKQLLREIATQPIGLELSFIIGRFLLLMDFANSTCFLALNTHNKKMYTGEELVKELFVYNLKVVKEYINLFEGKMENNRKLMDKARDIVESEEK